MELNNKDFNKDFNRDFKKILKKGFLYNDLNLKKQEECIAFYKHHYETLNTKNQTLKTNALQFYNISSPKDQEIISCYFFYIFVWHRYHVLIPDSFIKKITPFHNKVVVLLIPMLRCPYLEMRHLYDTLFI
tara:strand:+ start:1609 stop:2001 length:393 start_codon:yes stop_codon:yes gene_type:complete